MKKTILLLSCLLLAACSGNEPGFSLLDGGIAHFKKSEKLVLINYWAEWCSPCREEIPEFNKFARENADSVLVYAVNFDGIEGDDLRRQVADMGIEFHVLLQDPRLLWSVEFSGVLPETLVIDQEGKFQQRLIGPQKMSDLEALLLTAGNSGN